MKEKIQEAVVLSGLAIITAVILCGVELVAHEPSVSPFSIPLEKVSTTLEKAEAIINTKEGELFLMQGNIINNTPEAIKKIKIRCTLKDKNHKLMDQIDVYAGNYISLESLKKFDIEMINILLMNPPESGEENDEIQSENSIPYTCVFKLNRPEEEVVHCLVEVLTCEIFEENTSQDAR